MSAGVPIATVIDIVTAPTKGVLVHFLLILVLAAALPAGAATVYQWTDGAGRVHFGDRPPLGSRAIDLVLPLAGSAGAPVEPEADNAAGAGEQPAREESALEEASVLQLQNCERAREQLAHNEGLRRLYRLDEAGERQYLGDDEHEALLRRSRGRVAEWCD